MIQDYLLNRKQRTKIRSSYSTLENITSGVPQVSILGPPPCLRSFHVTYFWNMRILVSLTKQVINTLGIANNTAEVIENLTSITRKLLVGQQLYQSKS